MEIINHKKIAINTINLYLRMLIITIVSLITTRVILKALGVESYGTYQVIAGTIVLFTFFNNAMLSTTQRFLNYEIGKNNVHNIKKVFNISVTFYLIAIIFLFLSCETVGIWLINNVLKIAQTHKNSVDIAYQFIIIQTSFKIIQIPYNAVIIANEKMSFYALLSIIEAILSLIIAYLITKVANDKLVVYSILMCLSSISVFLCYYFYCIKTYNYCKYNFCWDKTIVKNIFVFSGWSLFGSVAVVGKNQGINLLLNYYAGVAINAVFGIATQLSNAIHLISQNVQTAFNPQIIKAYASQDKNFYNLIYSSSKYSYSLVWIAMLPLFLDTSFFLSLWLSNIPNHLIEFVRLFIVFQLLETLSGPLGIGIQATGKIAKYQLIISTVFLLNVPTTYLLLKLQFSPETVISVMVVSNVVALFARILIFKIQTKLNIIEYFQNVIVRITLLSLLSCVVFGCQNVLLQHTQITKALINLVTTFVLNSMLIYFIILNSNERKMVQIKFKKIVSSFCKGNLWC